VINVSDGYQDVPTLERDASADDLVLEADATKSVAATLGQRQVDAAAFPDRGGETRVGSTLVDLHSVATLGEHDGGVAAGETAADDHDGSLGVWTWIGHCVFDGMGMERVGMERVGWAQLWFVVL